MLDLNDADKKVNQLDKLLTSISNLFKKHWLMLTFLGLLAFGYWAYRNPTGFDNLTFEVFSLADKLESRIDSLKRIRQDSIEDVEEVDTLHRQVILADTIRQQVVLNDTIKSAPTKVDSTAKVSN